MFDTRQQAGELLSEKLLPHKGRKDTVVLSIPRGGVPVAKAMSKKLDLSLDVVITKKIGAPDQEELAIGAVSEGGDIVLDKDLIARMSIGKSLLEKQIQAAKAKVESYKKKFIRRRELKNKTAILVDDGIATGATVEAAIEYLINKKVKKIILAVPVAPPDTVDRLKPMVDKTIVLQIEPNMRAVGQFYRHFPQVTDEEVLKLLQND